MIWEALRIFVDQQLLWKTSYRLWSRESRMSKNCFLRKWRKSSKRIRQPVSLLREKVEDMENRNRRNNLRFIGVSEGKENGNTTKYMEDLKSTVVDTAGNKRGIEWAHKALGPRPNPEDKTRPILVRFLRSGDRDAVLRAGREKGEIQNEGNWILVFPDFARATQIKQEKFRKYKRVLHAQGVKFAIMYPATLRIETGERYKRFACPKAALRYVMEMGL